MRGEEENSGLHLLKKHKKTLLRAVFSRAGLIALLLLVQVALITLAFSQLRDFLPHYVSLMAVFSGAMALYLLNSRHDPSAKLTWIVVILMLPVFGALLYAYTQSDLGHRLLKRRFAQVTEETRESIPQDAGVLARAAQEAPELLGLANYVGRTGCYPAFDKSRVRYFPLGDELFPALLEELEKAEKFIFLEFFIEFAVFKLFLFFRLLRFFRCKCFPGSFSRVGFHEVTGPLHRVFIRKRVKSAVAVLRFSSCLRIQFSVRIVVESPLRIVPDGLCRDIRSDSGHCKDRRYVYHLFSAAAAVFRVVIQLFTAVNANHVSNVLSVISILLSGPKNPLLLQIQFYHFRILILVS